MKPGPYVFLFSYFSPIYFESLSWHMTSSESIEDKKKGKSKESLIGFVWFGFLQNFVAEF